MNKYFSMSYWLDYLKNNKKELFFYGVIGVVGLIIDFSIFFMLLFFNMPTLYAQWLAALAGSTHNHFWHHYRVFDHNQRFKRTYPIAMMISFVSVVLSGPLLVFMNEYVELIWVSKLVVIAIFTAIQYVLRKKIVFVNK